MKNILSKTNSTTLWLLRIMLPVSLVVQLLQRLGVIDALAVYLTPLFQHMGLPGQSAIAFLTGAFASTYAGVAALVALDFTLREGTIIGIMICICHSTIVESTVVKKTGSSFWTMFILRFVGAVGCAFFLNAVLPDMPGTLTLHEEQANLAWNEWTISCIKGLVKMSIMVYVIILILMLVQHWLDHYGLIPVISKPLSPLMRVFGLVPNASYMWIVGNVLGLSYGSAVMLEIKEKGLITTDEANELNFHLVFSHSLVEDTLVFAALGIPAFWIIFTRLLFAMIAVWGRKAVMGVCQLVRAKG